MSARVGKPQWISGTLLLVFLAQCAWLVTSNLRSGEMDLREWYRLDTGLRVWHRAPRTTAAPDPHAAFGPGPPPRIRDNGGFDPDHSALWYLTSSAPLLLWPGHFDSASLLYWGWLARLPHIAFGLLLGASLWYVARRLYGNEGGFIALTLYCFSPGMIRAASLWYAEPELGAAWGAFGTIFTGIAVAHTLYAPREVVLWNWRRTLLLGVSLALAIGSQFSLFVIAPVALAFMLYLAPTRRAAAAVIWTTACGIALLLLFAAYFFIPGGFWEGFRHATWLGITWQAFAMTAAYREFFTELDQGSPALVFALPFTLAVYLAWPRARYFGNTAPLLVAVLCLVLGLGTPHYQGLGFQLVALPFLFVFVAGISADLLETKNRSIFLGGVAGLLLVYIVLSVHGLIRAGLAR
ncbi:MAG TPA: hypothetical protein VK466_03375 [Terriglobales bacterium]|nr:hypothetical protein [Terriglobales bacterium]